MTNGIIDTYRQKGLRKQLIDRLRKKKQFSEPVLAAMMNIPRHIFVDEAFTDHIYQDKAFPIASGQTISHPSTVAYQSTVLNLSKNDIVLEVGTGSGYQTLILAELSKYVLSIERQKELFQQTKKRITHFPYKNIELFYGDGYKGLVHYAPFDKIIVTCGAEKVPQELVNQLKPGGRMLVPVGGKQSQTMIILDKQEDGIVVETKGDDFSFVPMLEGKQR